MRQRNIIWIMCIAVAIVLITGALVRGESPRATSKDCIDPATERECSEAKMTRIAVEATIYFQTAEALPSFTPVPTSPLPIETSTPEPLPTIVIRQLIGEDLSAFQFRGAISVWLVGVIESSDPYERNPIFVLSRPSEGALFSSIRYTFGGNVAPSAADREKYNSYWFAPHDIGTITITGVTGIDGIVSFTTSTGVIGTFDLATKQWLLQ